MPLDRGVTRTREKTQVPWQRHPIDGMRFGAAALVSFEVGFVSDNNLWPQIKLQRRESFILRNQGSANFFSEPDSKSFSLCSTVPTSPLCPWSSKAATDNL